MQAKPMDKVNKGNFIQVRHVPNGVKVYIGLKNERAEQINLGTWVIFAN